MSTLAASPVAKDPWTYEPAELLFIGILAALSLLAFVVAMIKWRIHRPSAVAGPSRLDPHHGVGPLWAAIGVAIVGLFTLSFAYGLLLAFRAMGAGRTASPAMSDLDLVLVSVAGPIVGMAVGLGLLRLIQPGSIRAIGLSWGDIEPGVRWGVAAALVVVPWTFLVGSGTEWFYRLIRFTHPSEHDLLRIMKEGDLLIRTLGIAAAVVVAPVAEEFFFRGLLQTALTEGLSRWRNPRPAPILQPERAFPVLVLPLERADQVDEPSAANPIPIVTAAEGPIPLPPTLGQTGDLESPPDDPTGERSSSAWIAILLTSLAFGAVHPGWTFPIIFFLSICLGYVYERTGKLWAPMALHAAFNLTSTVLFLTGMSSEG